MSKKYKLEIISGVLHKSCTRCDVLKPLDQFKDYPLNTKTGKYSWCYDCTNDMHRASYERRKKENGTEKQRLRVYKYRLKYDYGMTVEEYHQLHTQQSGKCRICGTDKPGGRHRQLVIDHCHETGKIRGLLCAKCNQGLGLFDDNPNFLASASDYLKRSG